MNDGIAPSASSVVPPDPIQDRSNETHLPRIDCVIEHDLYIAGRKNVVRLLLTNPYDRVIEIMGVETPQTSSFEEYTRPPPSVDGNMAQTIGHILGRTLTGMSLTMVGVSVEIPQSSRRIQIYAEKNANVEFDRPLSDYEEINVYAEQGGKIHVLPEHHSVPVKEKKTAILHARSTIVIPVSVKTSQWLLFTPQRFGLNVEITFKFDNSIRTQVVNAQMDIRPPLSSMLYGAILGGFLGSLVASLNKPDPTGAQTALRCLTSVLMSVIAAVSLSRKGNVQAFVTVEDFYGAFFIGSLIGYGGVAFFEKAVLPTTSPAARPD